MSQTLNPVAILLGYNLKNIPIRLKLYPLLINKVCDQSSLLS